MASTFVIGSTTANFGATLLGSQQEAGDLERLTLGISIPNETDWGALFSLVTTKYAVHVPLGGDPVIDIVNGPGAGTLTVPNLGTWTAILIGLSRDRWAQGTKTIGSAVFLIVAAA